MGSGKAEECDTGQPEWVESNAVGRLEAAVARREAIGKWRCREGLAGAAAQQTYLAPGSG